MAKQLHVAFVWHMHQPLYKDRGTGRYLMPWVRLHAQKDYLDMLAILREHPGVRQTFNLVPSLVEQLQDYAIHEAWDDALSLLVKPVESLTADDEATILARFFDLHWPTMGAPHARYAELREHVSHLAGAPVPGALAELAPRDWRDLSVWFNLAWFDPLWLRTDPILAALVAKGRDFDDADRARLLTAIRAHLGRVLPGYRELAESGQIELTTSPYYHPILPLLCDTESARVALPELPLPVARFAAMEDAREQIQRGLAYFATQLGRRPEGMWPSEQAVSPAALSLMAEAGVQWAISDEGILARTLGLRFGRNPLGVPLDATALYRPYRVSTANGPVTMVFRDIELSDAIGFRYAQLPAGTAAADLHGRLSRIRALLPDGEPHLVTIALDGENCWEHYENDGADFLHAFYGRVEQDPALHCVTVSEYLAAHPPTETLDTIHTGSWIASDLTTWIGEPTKNHAWDLLTRTRADLVAAGPAAGPDAWEEVLVAEGSDWFWWYGEGHDSGQDAHFDAQFRLHLQTAHILAGLEVPEELYLPLTSPSISRGNGPLEPSLDGRLSLGEWEGASVYDVAAGQGAMHAAPRGIAQVRFGCGTDDFCVAVSFSPQYHPQPGDELLLLFYYPGRPRLNAPLPFQPGQATGETQGYHFSHALHIATDRPLPGQWMEAGEYGSWYLSGSVPTVALGEVLELALPLALLDQPSGQEIRFALALVRGETLVEVLPHHEALTFTMPTLRERVG